MPTPSCGTRSREFGQASKEAFFFGVHFILVRLVGCEQIRYLCQACAGRGCRYDAGEVWGGGGAGTGDHSDYSFVNKSAELGCSFPVSVYGKQQSVNPYAHPHGGDCGNSLTVDGKQLLDKDVYANHIDNSVSLQRAWVEHLVAKFGTAAKGGVPFYQMDNERMGGAIRIGTWCRVGRITRRL